MTDIRKKAAKNLVRLSLWIAKKLI